MRSRDSEIPPTLKTLVVASIIVMNLVLTPQYALAYNASLNPITYVAFLKAIECGKLQNSAGLIEKFTMDFDKINASC